MTSWPPATAMGLAPKFVIVSAGLLAGYIWYRRSSEASTEQKLREIEKYGELASNTVFDMSGPTSVPTVADVILLHGIGGSHVFDFCEPDASKTPEAFMQESWFQRLLPSVLKKPVRVLSLRVNYTSIFAPPTRPVLDELALHLLHYLSLVGVGTGHRPLVFICRDMSGMLVKAMIANSQMHPAYKTMYCNIAGVRIASLSGNSRLQVLFVGSPHQEDSQNTYRVVCQTLISIKASPPVMVSDHVLFLMRELNRNYFVQHPNFFYQTLGPSSDIDGFPPRFMLQLQGATLRYIPVTNYEHATSCKPQDGKDMRLLTIASFINEALSFGNHPSYAKP